MNPPKSLGRDGGISSHPVVKSFLSGSFSGFCSTVLFQPFDLIKTRLQEPRDRRTDGQTATTTTTTTTTKSRGNKDCSSQQNGHSSATTTKSTKTTMYAVTVRVVRQDGVKGLWRGVTPSLARTVPGVGLYFGFLHSLKSAFNMHQRRLTAKETFLLGATSRVSAAGVLMPFTVIKARFESGLFDYRGVSQALLQISRDEGIKGLWSGMTATMFRDAPFSGLYLMFYTRAKDWAKTLPVANTKQYPTSQHSLSESTAFSQQRHPPSSASLYFPVSAIHFSCSILAGVLASAVTQPPDVVKTRMQLHPGRHRNVVAAAAAIYTQDGARGFFAGFVPRTMRRTLMAAATWTLYEHLMSLMGLT